MPNVQITRTKPEKLPVENNFNPMNEPDWKSADEHLKKVEEAYRRLIGLPGVYVGFAMRSIDQMRAKFNRGDRSHELYNEIMTFEV